MWPGPEWADPGPEWKASAVEREEPVAAWPEFVAEAGWVALGVLVGEHWLKGQADCWILQPEVGAEQWPSSGASGRAGWEGFLGSAESAQL